MFVKELKKVKKCRVLTKLQNCIHEFILEMYDT